MSWSRSVVSDIVQHLVLPLTHNICILIQIGRTAMQKERSFPQQLDAFCCPTDGQGKIFRPPTFDTFGILPTRIFWLGTNLQRRPLMNSQPHRTSCLLALPAIHR